jgi:mono/diheme cytochrome c family protein
MAEGFAILNTSCFSCHAPDPDRTPRVAPTMGDIRKSYMKGFHTEVAFHEGFLKFMKNPSPANARLKSAVKEYGPMPVMSYKADQIQAIAHYIYNTPMDAEGWYEKEFEKEKIKYLSGAEELTPVEKGKTLAMKTKGVLGKNLLNAIKTEGTMGAVSFCSERAYHLTDSMATELGASIKRVSDKNRNPNNAANAEELAYIESAKTQLENGEDITPGIREVGDKTIAYYPIITNQMCLQCHGEVGKDITPEVYEEIQRIYPQGQAVGYRENQLRGIWVVELESEK